MKVAKVRNPKTPKDRMAVAVRQQTRLLLTVACPCGFSEIVCRTSRFSFSKGVEDGAIAMLEFKKWAFVNGTHWICPRCFDQLHGIVDFQI